jgi:hypothetical protein
MRSLLLWALASQIAVAADSASITVEKTIRYQASAGTHRIELVLRQGPLVPEKHKIEAPKDGKPAMIDGIPIAGTDGGPPHTSHTCSHLQSVELKWDGKKVPVEARHYVNLLDLSLEPGWSIQFIPSPKGDALLIQATGGDGGGSYLTSLVLRQDGNHKQFEAGYHESGLPHYPYEINEYGKATEDGVEVNTFNWLPADKEKK